jgi:hypothetical protein
MKDIMGTARLTEHTRITPKSARMIYQKAIITNIYGNLRNSNTAQSGENRMWKKEKQRHSLARQGVITNQFGQIDKPARWSDKRMEDWLEQHNILDGTVFELNASYGYYELWANGRRLDAGSLQDIYKAWIKYRFSDKAKPHPGGHSVSAPVKINSEWVIKWMTNGKRDERKTNYTDDKDDAYGTYELMKKEAESMNTKGR